MNLKSSSYNSSYSNLKDAIMGSTNSTNLAKKHDIEYSYRQAYRNDFKSYNFIHSNNSNINITEMPKTSVNFYSNKIQNYRNIGLNNDRLFSGVMENKRGISENKSTHGFNENLSLIKNYPYNLSSLISNNLNSPKSNTKNLFASDLIYQEVEGVNKVRPISSSMAINDSRQYSYSSNNKYHSLNNSRLLSPNTNSNKKTLILDLDETLVHSSFKPFIFKSDIILNIDLDRKLHTIHVLKRPGVHEFLERMSKLYEVVIFTASLSPYANPLIDQLDKQRHASCRLFREHCTHVNGMYVKDMKRLGRDLKDIIIIDNNPISYSFNVENGIPIKTWYNDKSDRELYNLIPILEHLATVFDVRDCIPKIVSNNEVNYKLALSMINKNREIYNNYTPIIKHDNFLDKKKDSETITSNSELKPTYIKNPSQTYIKSNTYSGGFGNNYITNSKDFSKDNSELPVQNININIISHNYSNFYLNSKNSDREKINNNNLQLDKQNKIKERKISNDLNTYDKSRYPSNSSSFSFSHNANFFNKSSSSINSNSIKTNQLPQSNISSSHVKKNPVNLYSSNSQNNNLSFVNSNNLPNHNLSKISNSLNLVNDRPVSAVTISNKINYLSSSTSSPLSISSYSNSKPRVNKSKEKESNVDRDRKVGNNINSLINSMNTPKRNNQKNSSNNSKALYTTSDSSNFIQRKLSYSNLRSSYEENRDRNRNDYIGNSRSVDRTKLKSTSNVSDFNSNKIHADYNYKNDISYGQSKFSNSNNILDYKQIKKDHHDYYTMNRNFKDSFSQNSTEKFYQRPRKVYSYE